MARNEEAGPDALDLRPVPALWAGTAVVDKVRMRLWSCQGYIEGLEDLHPV